MPFLLCIFTLFFSCGEKREGHVEPSMSEKLSAKVKLYCDLSRPQYEAKKYVGNECDSLLYTSLHLACDYVATSQFESQVEPGQYFRNPGHNCLIRGESDSDISKDMFTGLAIFLDNRKDLNAVKRVLAFGEQHNWILGEGPLSKTFLAPTGVKMFKDIEAALSMFQVITVENLETVGINVGFRGHLDVLGLLLRGKLSNLFPIETAILREQAKRQPRNALFKAAYASYDDGDLNPVYDLLFNESFFPADRLPTSNEYCTGYLWERDDEPSDWAPCPGENKTHSGTDFLIAAYVANGGFNQGAKK